MPITIENKCGLILGVANERSIAWGISKVLSNSGAEIALSYQNENLFKRVGPLAESINAKICMLADVQNENSLDNLFSNFQSSIFFITSLSVALFSPNKSIWLADLFS